MPTDYPEWDELVDVDRSPEDSDYTTDPDAHDLPWTGPVGLLWDAPTVVPPRGEE